MIATEALTAISFFAATFGVLYVAVSARHRERMAMIEKGVDAASLISYTGLRLGYMSVGAGAGLGLGWFADSIIHRGTDNDNPAAYFIGILVCSGLALIMAHQKVADVRRRTAQAKGITSA